MKSTKSDPNLLPQLPPELLELASLLDNPVFQPLIESSKTHPVKVLFRNCLEPLDLFFAIDWLIKHGIMHLEVDFVSSDSILIKRTAEGLFSIKEVEQYCQLLNLHSAVPWAHPINEEKARIDSSILLKIQFHWEEKKGDFVINDENYDIIIEANLEIDCNGDFYLDKDSIYAIDINGIQKKLIKRAA